MSDIDRQRIAGVKTLLALGFTWHEGRWVKPAALATPLLSEADALHALLVDRADQLMGCIENSADEDELVAIGEAIEAYELKRWPVGKEPGGKG
jgi:hypothetical protein